MQYGLKENEHMGIPWWLSLCASNARGTGSLPGQGTNITHAGQCGQKKKKFFLIKKKRERDGINIVYMFALLFPQEIDHLMKQVTKCQFIFNNLQFH